MWKWSNSQISTNWSLGFDSIHSSTVSWRAQSSISAGSRLPIFLTAEGDAKSSQ